MVQNLFTNPPRLPLVAPSILSADFADMGEDCRHVLSVGGDLLHVDVMDGHFVPNLTMGPDMVRAVRRAVPHAFLDVHLMVEDPERFIGPFAEAGANHITFHVEVVAAARIAEVSASIRARGLTSGLAINPPTSVEALLPHVGDVDLVLLMSVNPGYSGQAFIAEVLDKAAPVRKRLKPGQRLEIDGGVKPGNAGAIRGVGIDVLVAATAVFGVSREQRGAAIAALR